MTRPTRGATARLARYGFTAGATTGGPPPAAVLVGPTGLGLWDEVRQGPVDEAAAGILADLGRGADPDLALHQLHRMVEAEQRGGAADPVLPAIRADPGLRRRLAAVLGASSTLGDHLVANPGEWRALSTTADGGVPLPAPGDLALHGEQGAHPDTVAELRRVYRVALLRVAAADLTGRLTLEQTMGTLSALADATLRAAYRIAASGLPAQTPPPRLAVVAMGKCGGQELNYVSDVDVVFVVAANEDIPAATTVAAGLMRICGQVAWVVDAALRPEGHHGPLVRTLASHLAYYRTWARTWEFQALLKARPAAGDQELAREWLDQLRPLIWHAAERPEAVDDIRAMRRRIIDSIPRKELSREIKRGPGGLRDIEFAVQLLQLVHGRADDTLRSPSTLDALRALVDGGYVGRTDGEALVRAYRFLRTVEHRLQLQRLRRTHTVPDDPAGLRWLAHALGYTTGPAREAVEQFRAEWIAHAGEVRRLHAKLLYRPLLEAVAKVPTESLRLSPEAAKARLEVLGFADPRGALRHIEVLTGGVSRTAAIQRTLLPVLLEEFADVPEPDRGLLSYRRVSDKLGSTPWYLRLLRDEGPVALRLARLLGLSRYITDLLTRDPEALRLLADDTELTPRGAGVLRDGFVAAAARHQDASPARGSASLAAIAAVRALRRRELFRLACTDLLSGPLGENHTGLTTGGLAPRDPLAIADLGVALADVTDATLNAAMRIAGVPAGLKFAVIGMGRLGGQEMSYPSDADVLFIYEAPAGMPDPEASGAAHTVAEEMRRLLSAPAPDPPLGIDADLRPEGRQGPLVRSLTAYQAYYARWSKVWEAQALLRARFVCGDPGLGARFIALADRARYPAGGLTREQITEIRRIKARVETERLPRGADPATHTKLGRGGLADVEWTVQLLQLRHGFAVPALRTTRTLDALTAAREAGLADPEDAAMMAAGWTLASRIRNALTLVRGRPSDQLPRHGPDLAGVVRILGGGEPGAFLDQCLRTARRSRTAVERVFHA